MARAMRQAPDPTCTGKRSVPDAAIRPGTGRMDDVLETDPVDLLVADESATITEGARAHRLVLIDAPALARLLKARRDLNNLDLDPAALLRQALLELEEEWPELKKFGQKFKNR